MSAAIRRNLSLACCALSLGLLANPVAAQSRDPLPEVRERLKIEAQRVEKDVHDGRMRAYRLFRSDPNEAYAIIKGLIGTLRQDTALSEDRRALMMQTLKRDLGSLRALANVRRTSDPAAVATRIEMRRTEEPRGGEDKKSAVDTATARINQITGRVADSRAIREKSNDRFTTTITQVVKSSTPAASDYDFPPDWLERTKKRSPEAKLTAQEKALLNALKKPVKVDYNMQTFQSVLDHLSAQMGQDILTDKQSMEEANVTYDSPITLRFNKPISARTALKRVLADVGLTYVIRKEHIEVTTPERAKHMLTTRTYYIGDLLGLTNSTYSRITNQFQAIQAVGMILSQIQGIDPDSWDGNGGAGRVTFDPIRMVLVVRQSAEMHYMLSGR